MEVFRLLHCQVSVFNTRMKLGLYAANHPSLVEVQAASSPNISPTPRANSLQIQQTAAVTPIGCGDGVAKVSKLISIIYLRDEFGFHPEERCLKTSNKKADTKQIFCRNLFTLSAPYSLRKSKHYLLITDNSGLQHRWKILRF